MDNIIRKKVNIISGPYKGYNGYVTHINPLNKTYTIIVEASGIRLNILQDHCIDTEYTKIDKYTLNDNMILDSENNILYTEQSQVGFNDDSIKFLQDNINLEDLETKRKRSSNSSTISTSVKSSSEKYLDEADNLVAGFKDIERNYINVNLFDEKKYNQNDIKNLKEYMNILDDIFSSASIDIPINRNLFLSKHAEEMYKLIVGQNIDVKTSERKKLLQNKNIEIKNDKYYLAGFNSIIHITNAELYNIAITYVYYYLNSLNIIPYMELSEFYKQNPNISKTIKNNFIASLIKNNIYSNFNDALEILNKRLEYLDKFSIDYNILPESAIDLNSDVPVYLPKNIKHQKKKIKYNVFIPIENDKTKRIKIINISDKLLEQKIAYKARTEIITNLFKPNIYKYLMVINTNIKNSIPSLEINKEYIKIYPNYSNFPYISEYFKQIKPKLQNKNLFTSPDTEKLLEFLNNKIITNKNPPTSTSEWNTLYNNIENINLSNKFITELIKELQNEVKTKENLLLVEFIENNNISSSSLAFSKYIIKNGKTVQVPVLYSKIIQENNAIIAVESLDEKDFYTYEEFKFSYIKNKLLNNLSKQLQNFNKSSDLKSLKTAISIVNEKFNELIFDNKKISLPNITQNKSLSLYFKAISRPEFVDEINKAYKKEYNNLYKLDKDNKTVDYYLNNKYTEYNQNNKIKELKSDQLLRKINRLAIKQPIITEKQQNINEQISNLIDNENQMEPMSIEKFNELAMSSIKKLQYTGPTMSSVESRFKKFISKKRLK